MPETQPTGEARPPRVHDESEHETYDPGRGGVLTTWLLLLGVLVVCAVPMLVAVGRGDTRRTMENITLLSAQETWLRQHGWQDIEADPKAWLIPSYNGAPRIVKPPLVIWMDMLAWSGLTPRTSTTEQLIFRARLVSVGMGLLTVAGVYWIGGVLGDRKLAVMSALAAGTCLFLERQARIASYDIHMTGWATLAVASALWAMRPFGPPAGKGRAVFGWCLAGVALACAFMSKGPLALLVGAAPVACAVVVVRQRWRAHGMGLLLMLVLAGLLTGPWYLYIAQVVSNVQGQLLHEYSAQRMIFQPPYYYVGLLGLMLPWSVWLFAGLLQPFMRSTGQSRRRLMVAWVWFALIFVAFSIPGAKQQRYILPIVPAAALLIGQLWCYHGSLARRGEVDPGVNTLRVPHWAAMITVSVLVWPFFVSQEWMLDRGWFSRLPVGDAPGWAAALAGIVLTGLAVVGASWHYQWKPLRAGFVTAVWSAVLMTLVWFCWSTGERGVHPVKAPAQAVARVIDGGVIRYFVNDQHQRPPNEEFLLYARRIIKPITPQALSRFGQEHAPHAYVMAPLAQDAQRALGHSGYEQVTSFLHDRDQSMDLWKYVGHVADPNPDAPDQPASRPDPAG